MIPSVIEHFKQSKSHGKTIVLVVKHDLDIRRERRGAFSLVQQSLTLFPGHVPVRIIQHEPDGPKEIGFSRPVAPNNDIVVRGKRCNDRLVSVRLEPKDCQLIFHIYFLYFYDLFHWQHYLMDVHARLVFTVSLKKGKDVK